MKIIINKLNSIIHCTVTVSDFMVLTGPQASGKSTVAKCIFFFKNIKYLLFNLINKHLTSPGNNLALSIRNALMKDIRSKFLQTFGTTWCMDNDMFLEYYYTDDAYIKIRLKNDPISPNYIWIDFSSNLICFLDNLEKFNFDASSYTNSRETLMNLINDFFNDYEDIIYIPAGRSMMTLFSSQLMFMYSIMNDDQKRSLDYCTQNYLERIIQLKPLFSNSLETLIKNKIYLTDTRINKENLLQCSYLMKNILQGEYRNIGGEERLQISEDKYVKINFASSGQQEAVWILYVIFYYLLNSKKSFFIIEEPESHLFPNSQKLIAEFISLARNDENKILVTTHSPYILGSINNMLYADKISNIVDKAKLGKIIYPLKWIPFNKLSAFYVEHGTIQPCLDEDFRSINHEIIDGASDEINSDYEKMVYLEHGHELEV